MALSPEKRPVGVCQADQDILGCLWRTPPSFATKFNSVAFLLVLAILSACAPRGTIQFQSESADIGSQQRILVTSLREPVEGPAVLSGERASALNFYDFSVSVPPDRPPGTVRFSNRTPPDPRTDFVTVNASKLPDMSSFERSLDQMIADGVSPESEVVLFIHGFNTNFAEGLYRQAQLAHDFNSQSVSVHFSWASAGSVRSYAFDRESALLARDSLEIVLEAIQRTRAERIVIIAHSMGAQIAMETLRQMAIRNGPAAFDKLSSVVLVAPDLDVDLFVSQAQPLAMSDVPIYVFVSNRDRALQVSALLRGRRTARLGLVTDAAILGDLPVAIIDTSEFEGNGDPLQHFKAATSPTMIALFSGTGTAGLDVFARGNNQPTLLVGGAEIIQDAASAVLGPR